MSHLASEQDKASPSDPLGMYVHVPFCASTCDFCAFYQTKPTAGAVERFLTGIEDEAKLVKRDRPVTTVFWGGGTPGLLSPHDLARLAEIVRARCGGVPQEWTVELAPASVTPQRLAASVCVQGDSRMTAVMARMSSARTFMLAASCSVSEIASQTLRNVCGVSVFMAEDRAAGMLMC